MARIYDISRTVSPSLTVWPGDPPIEFEEAARMARGDSVNVTQLKLGTHTGTHIDAPWHFDEDGAHTAELPPETFIGPARVITVERRSGTITPADLGVDDLGGVERVLLRTWVSDVPDDEWPEDYPYPSVELADWLAGQGVRLLGVDLPTVDDAEGEGLPAHHRLNEHGITILERVNLSGVPDGVYELIALPLKLAGLDGSPVRAVLREMAGD